MPAPLRILLVLATPGTGWGGMETHTSVLAEGLARAGKEVHVAAHPAYRDRFNPAIRFHGLPMNLGRRNPWLRFRLRQLLKTVQPDICHAQGNKAAQLLSSHRRGHVRAGTVHGTKSSHRNFRSLEGVIAVSQQIHASLDHRRKALIHNGLPFVAPALGRPAAMPGTRPVVVTAGRLETVKGFDNLLRAWAQVSGPGQLVILGEGSQRQRLEQLRHDLGIEGSVSLPGYCENVRDWLAHADACIISSQREGFPFLLVEALLAGCPLLATPVSGVTEFLPAACLARDSSAPALAELLAAHLGDLEALGQNQSEAFARAERLLTSDAMIRGTLDFYRSLLSASHS
ncbi:glycosyltransferase [Marinobacter salicampi]|uniref:glycosyltransferase n=1 Tax=Marinobacter salicampi TaxID=435907 RepID=UPI001408E979|nr:glycosyltransferase [Marinobacter salicampi]